MGYYEHSNKSLKNCGEEIRDECPTFHMGFEMQEAPGWDDK
jgi:hypothetical protein